MLRGKINYGQSENMFSAFGLTVSNSMLNGNISNEDHPKRKYK